MINRSTPPHAPELTPLAKLKLYSLTKSSPSPQYLAKPLCWLGVSLLLNLPILHCMGSNEHKCRGKETAQLSFVNTISL